jgi:hypothetical protein
MRIVVGLSIGMLVAMGVEESTASAQQSSSNSEVINPVPVIKIDLRSLSPEVLKCNVCRMRLGLEPIAGGGTLDPALHDAQSQSSNQSEGKAIEAEDLPANSAVQSVQPSVDQLASGSDPTFRPSGSDQSSKKLEAHNSERQGSPSSESEYKLEQFASPSEATRFSTGNQSAVTLPASESGKLSSPTSIQIELELAKRQLVDRNLTIENFNTNQIQLESKIAELTATNKQYASTVNSQSTMLENLNTQLRQQSSESTTRLNQVQQELETTKRDLSVAVANQEETAEKLTKSTDTQMAELAARLKNAENRVEEFKTQADLYRRQRDGFERELQAMNESPAAKDKEKQGGTDLLQGSLEKSRRELDDARRANETLQTEVSELKQQVAGQQKIGNELEALQTQIDQQASQLLNAQAAWDAERTELLKKIPQEASPEPNPENAVKPARQQSAESPKVQIDVPSQARESGQREVGERPNELTTSEETLPKKLKDDSPSSPFRAGPKLRSRSPRQPKEDASSRHGF